MSLKTFLLWFWISFYQVLYIFTIKKGSIIMFLAIFLFKDSFLTIVTITFTSLIFSELLNVTS